MQVINGKYLKTYERFLRQFKDASDNPFDNKTKWLLLQEDLIKVLTRTESGIRKRNAFQKNLKASLGNPSNRKTKEEAAVIKRKISTIDDLNDNAFMAYSLFKSIGDGIAFTFIDKFDLKPQYFKESPGFISQKKGSRLERKCLRYAYKKGGIAILNDLTHVLKYSDVTLIKGYNEWLPIEIKSGNYKSARLERQAEKTKKAFSYIFEDTPTALYSEGQELVRQTPIVKWKDHVEKLNSIIKIAESEGSHFEELEPGHFLICTYNSEFPDFEKVLNSMKLVHPDFFSMNDNKLISLGYTPYFSIIANPDHYLDFLKGNLAIMHIMDRSIIKRISEEWNISTKWEDFDEGYILTFTYGDETAFKLSRHFFGRAFFEMVSIESMIRDSCLRFLDMLKDITP